MKEKVYLNRVNVDYQTLYARVKDYFARHGIEIDFTFIPSDYKNLTYRIANLPQGQRILLQPTMSNVVPIDLSYDFTSFVFNGREFTPPNIPTGYCYCPVKQPFIDINLDERTPEANYLLICHEHMHALVFKANLAGFPTQDVMDSYFQNNLPELTTSNFGQQWALLQPWIRSLSPATPTLPQVMINRLSSQNEETTGLLNARRSNGVNFSSFTLELPDFHNMPNISCIPKGTYQVKWTFSPRLLKFTYEIQGVLNRSGIRIHAANYYYELKGCIALGNNLVDINGDGKLDTINSRTTIANFENYMDRQPFTLQIL